MRLEINASKPKTSIKLEEGDGIIIGIDPELSISMHVEGDGLIVTAPINMNVKSFKITRDGWKETGIK